MIKLISPILNYSAEIWGFFQANQIERVHLQFCKRLLGVKRCTQNDFVYGELGRTPLLIVRHLIILKYWFKILFSSENKYIKQIYNVMLNDINEYPNKRNWASQIKTLLSTHGFHEVWLNQGVGDIDTIFICLQTTLK